MLHIALLPARMMNLAALAFLRHYTFSLHFVEYWKALIHHYALPPLFAEYLKGLVRHFDFFSAF